MITTKSRRSTFAALLVATITIACLAALGLRGAGESSSRPESKTSLETRSGQLVFFAVLEGLYRDGVTNSDVDLIIPPNEAGKPKFNNDIFVYACPLCHPAFEAFRLYRQRQEIFGLKRRMDTFGPGLEESVRTRLHSEDMEARRQVVEELISRWVRQRMEMMRLTSTEREEITREIAEGRKRGMGQLQKATEIGQVGQSRTNCPICDGSFGACQLAK